jgi:hypothetical protein
MIKNICSYKSDKRVELQMIEKRVLARGYTLEALENTITHY